MEEKYFSKTRLKLWGYAIYLALLPLFINLVVVVFFSIFLSPFLMTAEEYADVKKLGERNQSLFEAVMYMAFVIPSFASFYYCLPLWKQVFQRDYRNFNEITKSRFVNLPVVIAATGFIGWIISVIGYLFGFFYYNFTFVPITFVKYVLSNSLSGNICFVFLYYAYEKSLRRFIPYVTADGNLSEIPGTIKVSIRMRFFIFFTAVSFTPIVFFVDFVIAIIVNNKIEGLYSPLLFLTVSILLIGILFTFLVSSSFASPINELQIAAKKIQSGNNDIQIGIVKNDEIGYLGERFNEMAKGLKEKEFIKDTFGKVVDPEVRDYLLKGGISLGGELKEITVMFTDIRGFTSISEKLPPERVVEWLNLYFEKMSTIISEEGGLVNKFIGDAILAIFGAPLPVSNHADRALKAARKMREALIELNQQYERKQLPSVRIGTGIHSGKVLAGNIGSGHRLEYTVIGDTVNIASRIESYCKTADKTILLTEDTKFLLTEKSELHFLEKITVRGREKETPVYWV